VSRPARDAAVVAWYGRESAQLRALRTHVHGLLADALGAAFVPRAEGTLHSTVLGLDAFAPFPPGPAGEAVVQRTAGADLDGLLVELGRTFDTSPVVQFGGFGGDQDLPVTSRGQHLADRTLVRHGRTVVLVGWPVVDGAPSWQLDELRRCCVRRGFAHRYPFPDPDAHMVVGEVTDAAADEQVAQVRSALASQPFVVAVPTTELQVVTYTDHRLPPDSTEHVPIASLHRVGSGPERQGSATGR